MPYAHVERRPDGVALIRLDSPDSPQVLIGRALLQELRAALDSVQSDPAVRAVVLLGARPDSFVAGVDVQELMAAPQEAAASARERQEVCARLEAGKPVVAALHGPALGAGFELALACHRRIASDHPRTTLGLPEVQLGLLPAAGGTQRLPRLVGLRRALPLLLSGKRLRAREARRIRLLDELYAPEDLLESACELALALAEGSAPARRGLAPRDRLSLLPPLRRLALRAARRHARRSTHGHYPAPRLILRCVETGLRHGPAAGYAAESESFGRLACTPQARQLIWLARESAALRRAPAESPERPIRKLAVVGAGLMGEGIAAISLPLVEVVLEDVSEPALQTAARRLRAHLERRVRLGALGPGERDAQLERFRTTLDPTALAGADLVVEAVSEELDLKRRVLAGTETAVSTSAVIASNTSALPIASIATAARHPERVLGMHYFSPAPAMPLLEIVVGPATADWALLVARDFGTRQGKSIIVVRDGPGFFTTRVLARYLDEAMLLLEQGASVEAVDRAARGFGFPMGPCALLDEIGIDIGAHVSRFLARALPTPDGATDAVGRLFDVGFRGRKNGRGFYAYDQAGRGGRRKVNSEVYRYLGGDREDFVPPPREEIEDRLAYTFAAEAVRCLQEEIVACPRDADIGAVLGIGFPAFRGGPLHWLDHVGADHAAARLDTLVLHAGGRFRAPALLVDMGRGGRRFFQE